MHMLDTCKIVEISFITIFKNDPVNKLDYKLSQFYFISVHRLSQGRQLRAQGRQLRAINNSPISSDVDTD